MAISITKLVIESRLDPDGIKKGLGEAARAIQSFNRTNSLITKMSPANKDMLQFASAVQKTLNDITTEMKVAERDLNLEAVVKGMNVKEYKRRLTEIRKAHDQALANILTDPKADKLPDSALNAIASRFTMAGALSGKELNEGIRKTITKDAPSVGQRYATTLIRGATTQFRTGMAEIREQFAAGAIDINAFKRKQAELTRVLNSTLASGIGKLRERDLLTPQLHSKIADRMRITGALGGKALVEGMVKETNRSGISIGERYANLISRGAENKFRTSMAGIREQMARGVIDRKTFQEMAAQIATTHNNAVLQGISKLRGRGLLTSDLQSSLVGQFKPVGVRAGNAFLDGLNQQFRSRIAGLRERLFITGDLTPNAFRREANLAGVAYNDAIARELGRLRGIGQLTAAMHTELTNSLKQTGKEAGRRFGDEFRAAILDARSVGVTLTAALTVPIAAAGVAITKLGTDFQSAMIRVEAITQGTKNEMQALAAQARKLGNETQFTATDAGSAMQLLASQSLKTNQIMSAMPSVLQLAAAKQLEMADAADITTSIMFGYNKTADELAHVNDVIVKATTEARLSMFGLASSFRYVGPVASIAGIEFEETAAALTLLGRAGFQGTLAGTALRGIIRRLIAQTPETVRIFKQLGVQVQDASGKMIPLAKIMEQLEKQGISTSDIMRVFGDRAGPGMAALLAQGSAQLKRLTENLKNAGGTAQRIADAEMSGLRGAFREVESAVEEFGLKLGDVGLLSILEALARGFAKFTRELNTSGDWLFVAVGSFALLAAAVGPVVLVISGAAYAIFQLKNALVVFMGHAAMVKMLAYFSVGGKIALGIAAITAAIYAMGSAARSERAAMVAFQNAAQAKSTTDLEKDIYALTNARKILIRRIEFQQERLRDLEFNDPVAVGIRKALPELRNKLAQYGEMLTILQKRWQENADVAERARLEQLNAMLQLEDMDLGAGLSTAEGVDALKILEDRIDTVVGLYDLISEKIVNIKGVDTEILALYVQVDALLAKQGNKIDENTLRLAQMKQQLAETVAVMANQIPEIKVKVTPLIPPIAPVLEFETAEQVMIRKLEEAASRYEFIQNQLLLATLQGDQTMKDSLQNRVEAQRKVVADLAKLAIATLQNANLPSDKLKGAIDQIRQALSKLGIDIDAALDPDKLAKYARGVATIVRGLLNMGEALGGISEKTRQALNALANAFDAFDQFRQALKSGDVFGQIAGVFGSIAGIGSFLAALFDDPLSKERDEIYRQNNEELSRLRAALADFRSTIDVKLDLEKLLLKGGNIQSLAQIAEIIRVVSQSGNLARKVFEQMVKETGYTVEDLKRIADELNIDIFDSKGNVLPKALEQLAEALRLSALEATQFGKTLQDLTTKTDLFNNVFDIEDTAAQNIMDGLGFLKTLAPDLFEQFFGGLDLSNTTQVETALRKLTLALLENAIDLSLWGDILNKEELIEIINKVESGLDKLGDAANTVTDALLNVPTGFRIALERFRATTPVDSPTRFTDVAGRPVTPPEWMDAGSGNTFIDTITVNVTGKDMKAEEFADDLERVWKRRNMSRTGRSFLTGIPRR